jgi:hypothetical protein
MNLMIDGSGSGCRPRPAGDQGRAALPHLPTDL